MSETPGKRLVTFRKSLNMSQRAFAAAIGSSHARVGAMETDKVEPSRAFLRKISETYGISAEWLLNGRGAMVAEEGAHPIPVQQLDPLMLMLCGGTVKEEYTKAGIPHDSDTLFEDATWVYNEIMQRVTDPTDGDELEAVLPQVKLILGRKLASKN